MLNKKDYTKIVKIFNNRLPININNDIGRGRMYQHIDLISDFVDWLKNNPNYNKDIYFEMINKRR